MMAEAHEADDQIFVYTGGDQVVPMMSSGSELINP